MINFKAGGIYFDNDGDLVLYIGSRFAIESDDGDGALTFMMLEKANSQVSDLKKGQSYSFNRRDDERVEKFKDTGINIIDKFTEDFVEKIRVHTDEKSKT